jgi:hypothetical protein
MIRHLESHGVQIRVLMAGNILRHPAYRYLMEENGMEDIQEVCQDYSK